MKRARSFLASARVRVGLALLASIVLLVLVGPLFTQDPTEFLGGPLEPPSAQFWLGTTRQGQDVFAQTLVGGRTSLGLGFAVGLVTVLFGGTVGLLAGTLGGKFDEGLSLVTNVFLILPGLPLSVVLAAYLEASPIAIASVLSITGWAWNARVIRAQAATLAKKEYVEAAITGGESKLRVLFAEVLPNMSSVVASCLMNAIVHSLGAQVGLEFLGLGDVSAVTWGTNLYWAANNQALLTESWWTILPTGLLIALTGLSLVLIHFGLDEVSNPRLRAAPAYSELLKAHEQNWPFDTLVIPPAGTQEQKGDGGTASPPVLELDQLTVDYVSDSGRARAVDRLSLSIGRAEIFGLLGESGSGKSTAAMAALRLLPAPAVIAGGSARVLGQETLTMSPKALRDLRFRSASVVLQNALNALCPTLTIGQQLADTITCHERLSKPALEARLVRLLQLVGLRGEQARLFPHQLSGGMRQRVMIAMAMALEPQLVIMDEPTTALDVVLQREILLQLRALQARFGFSVLLISHDLSLMIEFCDRVGVMYAGRLVEMAEAKSLRTRAQHPYTRGLLQSFPALEGPRHRLKGIPGSPPDLRRPLKGCPFLPRCALGDSSCAETAPLLAGPDPARRVACFKAELTKEQNP